MDFVAESRTEEKLVDQGTEKLSTEKMNEKRIERS